MTWSSELNVLDRGDVVRALMNIRDEVEKVLEVLMPDEQLLAALKRCKHPADKVEEVGDMGDDESYHCTACGATQDHPFTSED